MIGIDIGSRKIAVASDTPDGICATFELKLPDACGRGGELTKMATWLGSFDLTGPVWVERPPMVRNLQVLINLAQTSGMIHGLLPISYDVAVASWKRGTVGRGNADKNQVAKWLRDTHPALYERARGDQDLIDATCIALFGARVEASGSLSSEG